MAGLTVIISCNKTDMPITTPTTQASVTTSSPIYVEEACGLELLGFMVIDPGSIAPTEYGFAVSLTNDIPTIDDTKLLSNNYNAETTQFTFIYNEVFFETTIYIRSFAKLNGNIVYGESIEHYLVNSLGLTFENIEAVTEDCSESTERVTIRATLACLPANSEYGIVFSKDNNTPANRRQNIKLGNFESSTQIAYSVDYSILPEDVNVFSFYIAKDENTKQLVFPFHSLPARDRRSRVKRLNDFPGKARAEAASFVVNDFGYVIGGYTANKEEFLSEVWRYDANNDSWEQMIDFPGQPKAFITSFVIDNVAYAGTGGVDDNNGNITAYDEFYKYDADQDRWEPIANAPVKGVAGVSFVIEGIAYVGMLLDENRSSENSFYTYNPVTNEWAELGAPLPNEAISFRASAVSINETGYVHIPYYNPSIFSYNPSNNAWRREAELAVDGNDGVALVLEDKFILTTGRSNNFVVEYDPATGIAQNICISPIIDRSEAIGFSIRNKMYIATGVKNLANEADFSQALETVYSLELL